MTNVAIFLCDAALTAAFFLIPWTRTRLFLVLAGIIACYLTWALYPFYYAQIQTNSERWYPYPVTSVVAAVYSDIAREYIAPLLGWRYGCAMSAGIAVYVLSEIVILSVKLRERLRKRKVCESSEVVNESVC